MSVSTTSAGTNAEHGSCDFLLIETSEAEKMMQNWNGAVVWGNGEVTLTMAKHMEWIDKGIVKPGGDKRNIGLYQRYDSPRGYTLLIRQPDAPQTEEAEASAIAK